MVAASTLTIAAVLPPMVWFSAAAIAFYVMRHGWRSGLIACGIAAAAAACFHALTLGQIVPGGAWFGLYSAAVFWSPVVVVSLVLRATERLELAAVVALVIAFAVVLGVFAYVDSPRALWAEQLAPFVDAVTVGLDDAARAQSLEALSRFGTGMLASGVLMNVLIGVFLGRSWQARLYQPGGFRAAFHAFRLPPSVCAVLGVLIAGAYVSGADLLLSLAMPAVVLLLVQGLAVVHGIVGIRGKGVGWLVALYVAMIFIYAVVLVVLVGLLDTVFDFRRRAQAGRESD